MANVVRPQLRKPIHFLSVDDFEDKTYEQLFVEAAKIKTSWAHARNEIGQLGKDKIASLLFTEPSTRTSMSFTKAAQLIGCHTVGLDIYASSIAKGETYIDTMCMAGMYADVLISRHGEKEGPEGTLSHIAKNIFPRISELRNVSVINAGEASGEHPTQALLDLFTIQEHFGRTNVHIGFLGDLKYGRTTHSLIKLASRFGATFTCIAPDPELQMPEKYLSYAAGYAGNPALASDVRGVIGNLDVLYVTRLQTERAQDKLHHRPDQKVSGYCVTPELLEELPETAIVMHPLPRVDELSDLCDRDPRAKYMAQAANGIPTRAALLQYCLTAG